MRYLMVSENRGSMCQYCPLDGCSNSEPCYHGYSYWSCERDEEIATNFDNAHFTGLSESRARELAKTDPVLAHWVTMADK